MNDNRRNLIRLALACLILLGLAIRVPHLADPPLGTRLYRSALLARGYAVAHLPGFSAAERRAAEISASRLAPIEPPVFERVAAIVYRVSGREALWIPRLIGVIFWLGGALAIWWLVAPTAGRLAGLAGVGVFLFLPFAVTFSQSFQPDGLLTALTAAAIAAMMRHNRKPGRWSGPPALALAAGAVFIKPMALFFVVPVELACATRRHGWAKGLVRSIVWTLAVLVPAAAWYVYVAFAAPSVFEDRFFPQLLVRAVFWTDWLRMLHRVVTLPLLVLALMGVILSRGPMRRPLAAAWGGYLVFGLLFTHHIHTHDYYSLPLLVLVAWALGALVARVAELRPAKMSRLPVAAVIAVMVASILWGWQTRYYRSGPESAQWTARFERIGRVVRHSASVISLDGNYGAPLSYHGRLVASNLPLSIDRAVDALAGRGTTVTAETRRASLGGDYFVCTLQPELDAQPDLRALLDQRFRVIDRDGTPDRWQYVVYDLRHTQVSVTPDRLSAFARMGDGAHPVQRVDLWAEGGTRWRIVVARPDLLDVAPLQGVGPAAISIAARPPATDVDANVDVLVSREGDEDASASLKVRVRSVRAGAPAGPFGFVDTPADPAVLGRDPLLFQGWALDHLCVRRVWVECRDRSGAVTTLGDAVRDGMRPDVAAAYPDASDVFHSAWALTLSADLLRRRPLPVVLHFYAENADGWRAEIGTRRIIGK
jgi:hypothetical protein